MTILTRGGKIDLVKLAKLARQTVFISAPLLVQTKLYSMTDAEMALADLADRGWLTWSPRSGLIKTYRVTPAAYGQIESGRSGRDILSLLFQPQGVACRS